MSQTIAFACPRGSRDAIASATIGWPIGPARRQVRIGAASLEIARRVSRLANQLSSGQTPALNRRRYSDYAALAPAFEQR
jgi:hypothetical protein